MSLDDYEIRELREAEKSLLTDFLYDNWESHILTLYLEANGKKFDEETRRLFVSGDPDIRRVETLPSVVAVHRASGKIVGFNMAVIITNPDLHWPPGDFPPGAFLEWRNAVVLPALRVNPFEMFPNLTKIAHVRQQLVAKEHRQRGLGQALMDKIVELLKAKNVELAYGLFTSPYSKRIAEKAGFCSVKDFDLADARDSKGDVMYPGVESYIWPVMLKEL